MTRWHGELSRRSFLAGVAGAATLGLPRSGRGSELVPTLSLLPFLARPTTDSILINARTGHTDAVAQLEVRPLGEDKWTPSGPELTAGPGDFLNWTVEGLTGGSSYEYRVITALPGGDPAPVSRGRFTTQRTGEEAFSAALMTDAHTGAFVDGTGPIEVEHVTIEPPFSNMSVLNSGDVDIIGTVNALGGETDDLRRRTSQRFTCTMSATRQIIWVLKEGGPGWTTVDDAYADEDARFCVGPLSNQITNAFFDGPGQNVYTEFQRDLDVCLAQLINGEVDAMVSPFPVDRYFPEMVDTTGDGERNASTVGLLRPIDTNFVAGTPLWIAID